GRPVDSPLLSLQAAEDVSAADHHTHLDAEVVNFLHLPAHPLKHTSIDRVAAFAAQHLAAELEDDTFILGRRTVRGGFAHGRPANGARKAASIPPWRARRGACRGRRPAAELRINLREDARYSRGSGLPGGCV